MEKVPAAEQPSAARPSRPLRLTLPLWAFVLTLALMLGAGLSFYRDSQRLVLQQEIEDLRDESKLFELLFEQIYREPASDINFLSGTPPIQGVIQALHENNIEKGDEWRRNLEQIFAKMLQTNPKFRQIRYIGVADKGRELVNVVRKSGALTVVKREDLQEKEHRRYFAEALARGAGQIYFSPIELNRERGEIEQPVQPVMRVATPIYDQLSNSVFGVVMINVDVGHIFKRFEEIDLKELEFFLANENGDFIYHPDPSMRFGFEFGKSYLMQDEFPELASVIERGIIDAGFTALADTHGVALASYYREIELDQFGHPNHLYVLLRHRSNTAGMGLKAYRNQSLGIAALAAFLVMGLAVFAARRLTPPLTSLTLAIESYHQSGNLAAIPITTTNEFSTLANSFRNLIMRLEDSLGAQEKSAQKALESSNHLQSILDSTVDAIITIDGCGRVLSCNRSTQTMFGLDEDEILGQFMVQLVPAEHLQPHEIQNFLGTLTSEQGARGFELWGRHKEGNRFPLLLMISQMDAHEGPLFTCLIRDTTEQKRAQRTLTEKHQQLELVIASTGVGFWDWQVQSGDVVFNERWANILGYSLEELQPLSIETWKQRKHPEDLVKSAALLDKYWQGDSESYSCETRMKHKNGHGVWVLDTGKVVEHFEDGRPKRMIGTHLDITERKEAEQQLAELSWRTNFALNVAGIGIWDYDIPTQELIWDERMYQLYGITESDFSGAYNAWSNGVHPDDIEASARLLEESITSGNDFETEFRVVWPNGEIRFIAAHGRLLDCDSNTNTRMVGTNIDITQRKLAEQEIYKLSRIASQTDNAVIMTNVQGQVDWVNDAFTRVTGYTIDDVLGRKPGDFLQGPETDPKTVTAIRLALRERRPCQFEILNYSKDGAPYWLELRIDPMFDENGKLQGFMAVEMDINARKESEKALARQKIMLESMSRQGGIGAWEIDLIKQQIYWSAMTRTIHEVPDDFEPDLETAINFYKEGFSRDTIAKVVDEGIKRGTPWHVELQIVTAKGNEVWVASTGQTDFKDGKCVRLFGSFQDIEARKHTEHELTRAKEEAEAAAEAKSQFLASMSHEIRTPMNGVLGMLNLMKNDQLNAEQSRRASLAKSSAESLLVIINDILDFSKVEAGKLELEILDFDLRSLLAEFAQTMAHRAEEKNLEVILDTTQVEQSLVRGDPGRLRQVLTNLVGNAVKFTHQGEILIRASLFEKTAESLSLICQIQDTGIGIAQHKIDHLFESFTQADSSTTRKYGGTGLGLAIVKNLCQLMGGDVSVQSQPGAGSCFTVTILLEPSLHSEQRLPKFNIQGAPILIVDDNTTNRSVLRGQLEQWGAAVTEAASGSEALALLESQLQHPQHPCFSVAILDMQMPEMDGADLGNTIRSDSRYKSTKLVMLTSLAQRGDAKNFAELGFDAYFSKPASAEDLMAALSVCMTGGQVLDQASPLVTHHYLHGLDKKSLLDNLPPLPKDARILVVEDNFINQHVAQGMLNDLGLDCELAGNGFEAITMLGSAIIEANYDIVMMDCQMPEMDGYEASRQIRQGAAGAASREIPIIALTANALVGDREKCLAAGMSDYLSKPLDPDALEGKLRHWLSKDVSLSNISIKSATKSSTLPSPEKPQSDIPTDKTWDRASALARVRGKEERLNTLIKMFVESSRRKLAELDKAIGDQAFEEAAKTAHSLKGNAGNLSAYKMMHIASDIDIACREENASVASPLLQKIHDEYANLQTQFEIHLQQHSNQDLRTKPAQ